MEPRELVMRWSCTCIAASIIFNLLSACMSDADPAGPGGGGSSANATGPSATTASQSRRPNFLIFVADDLGFDDLGMNGNPDVKTPNLNQLANESVQFRRFFVHPVCAPTRASLLTGRHFVKTGVWGVHAARDYINPDETLFSEVLKAAGYKTGMFGKWHNGVTDGFLPWQRGFDEAYMTKLYQYYDNPTIYNGMPFLTKGWVTENIANWTIRFMEQNMRKPFLAYVPLMSVHSGTMGDELEEWLHAPSWAIERYRMKGLSEALSRLYGMVEFMDFQIGRILAAVDLLDLKQDTVVLFMSDNGPINNGMFSISDWKRRNPSQLSGGKGEIRDNGIRSPLFIRWTDHFPPSKVDKALTAVMDICPTILALAKTEQRGVHPIDGVSLLPVLQSPQVVGEFWTKRTLFHTIPAPLWTKRGGSYRILPNWGRDKSELALGRSGRWAVREGDLKLMNSDGHEWLYDVEVDPAENTPILDDGKKNDLHQKLSEWWSRALALNGSFSIPVFNIGYPGSCGGQIVAMAAIEKSPHLTISSHDTFPWKDPGTFTKYKVHVMRNGTYGIRLGLRSALPQGAFMQINLVCDSLGHVASVVGAVLPDGAIQGDLVIPDIGDNGKRCRVECVLDKTLTEFRIKTIVFQHKDSQSNSFGQAAGRCIEMPETGFWYQANDEAKSVRY